MQHIVNLAVNEFRRDWPFMAIRLDSMRVKAATGGPACGVPLSFASALKSALEGPDGNHGDNNLTTDNSPK